MDANSPLKNTLSILRQSISKLTYIAEEGFWTIFISVWLETTVNLYTGNIEVISCRNYLRDEGGPLVPDLQE